MNIPENLLREIITGVRGKMILDIGSAGQGNPSDSEDWLFARLRRQAKSIQGIDPAHCNDPDVIQSDAEHFQLNQKFDVVTMLDVIEHLDNVGIALARIQKHLNPGGRLIITTPNMMSIGPVLDTFLFLR